MKLLYLVFSLFTNVYGYNILVLFPFPTKSHSILGDGFVKNLLKAGHQVTYITPSVWNNPPAKLRQISVHDNYKIIENELGSHLNVEKIMKKEFFLDIEAVMGLCGQIATTTLKTPAIQQLMRDPNEKFDAVITEWMFTELFSGLGVIFNCPFIWSSSLDSHWMVRKFMDESTNPAYTADYASTNIPPFTFKQRLEELWIQLKVSAIERFKIWPKTLKQYEDLYGKAAQALGRELPDYEDVKHNASLVFLNSHVSFGSVNSMPHNFKYIGGYHIETPCKPLPENLKKIMDEAKHGVIYFSMGSVLRSTDMPDELKTGLLKMFSKLKQTVIWKFEELLPNTPKNVHIVQWAPQQSILNHSNCILFITHGGLLSTTEAIHYGVPMIGVPMFADQYNNIEKAQFKGFAKKVDISYELPTDLFDAINDILNDNRYKNKMKHTSHLYHDRQHAPSEELIYWVEHVIRTKGAFHLRSPALTTRWYQKLFLDLICLLFVIIFIVCVVVRQLLVSRVVGKRKSD